MEYVELTNAGHIDPHVVNELDDDSQQVAEAMVQLGNMGYYPPEQIPSGGVEGDGMEFKIHQLSRHDQGKIFYLILFQNYIFIVQVVCVDFFVCLLAHLCAIELSFSR